jgi:pilus assembly protein Flp/PilA
MKENGKMRLNLWKFYCNLQTLFSREDGQDLIEYALVVALVALAAKVGMGSLAGAINKAFANIGTSLTSTL